MTNQPESETPDSLPVPDGQERLATQNERDYINEKIADSSSTLDD